MKIIILNPLDAVKAVLIVKFIVIQDDLRKQKSQINNLPLHLREVGEKKEQTKSRVSRGKEIIKIRAEINDIEMRKKQKILVKLRAGFLKR